MLAILKPQYPEIAQTYMRAVLMTPLRRVPGSDLFLRVKVRFDDECKNGHQSLGIYGDLLEVRQGRYVDAGGGQCTNEMSSTFPELNFALPWHLCSTDGPMHYVANTVYLAGDRDSYGLRAEEVSPILTRDGKPMWRPGIPDGFSPYSHVVGDCPDPITITYKQVMRKGEGKKRELDSARRCAIWPDATDEDLMGDPVVLRAKLVERLPGLLRDFHSVVTRLGFTTWEGPKP